MNSRESILSLLNGEKQSPPPAFSGLIHVTAEGLKREGLSLPETHRDAQKMARAAASTFRFTGLPSAAAPLDLYVEAEALGAQIDFRENAESEFPRVANAAYDSVKELTADARNFPGGRINIVCDAIRLLKTDIGNDAVIGGMIPGPYTLLLLLVEPGKMFGEMKKEPDSVHSALKNLGAYLAQTARAYRNAGADFITIHEMGGSPAFLGPARFEEFVLPALKQLTRELPRPRVLSVCGNTNKSMQMLAQAGAEAVSVDQTNDLIASRAALPDTLLFGNIDPVGTLALGTVENIRDVVRSAIHAGVDAIWPGCDLYPATPIENLKALQAGR